MEGKIKGFVKSYGVQSLLHEDVRIKCFNQILSEIRHKDGVDSSNINNRV